MADKNWLAQAGWTEIKDADFAEFGASITDLGNDNINRFMLDRVHAMNVEGYMEQGFTETEAKRKADRRKSLAIQAAKANGLTF
jgi:hypothetical protein